MSANFDRDYDINNLASSNMVSMRRDEIARLERKRLEINRKLERMMKRYAKLTGERKIGRRRFKVGYAPNDWRPYVLKELWAKLKTWQKVLIILATAAILLLFTYCILQLVGFDVYKYFRDLAHTLLQSASSGK